MKELIDYSEHGSRTSDFEDIVAQANYAIELQAENEDLKKELLFLQDLNHVRAAAIISAVRETTKEVYTEDYSGGLVVRLTVDRDALIKYANDLIKGEEL